MKKALVCGAGGFIAHHLVNRLKSEGYWVRGVDIKYPEFSKSQADEFRIFDLRNEKACNGALILRNVQENEFDEVYQLAADMGGMGFIHSAECDIMHNNILINTNMVHAAIGQRKVPRYFYSSSACVYRNMKIGELELNEKAAYPALPDNEYGWEKLYSERMALAYARKYGTQVRIARFQNTYGPEGTWTGGREKAPAAICRKVSMARNGGTIDVWGDGTAVRSYTYIDDLVDGIRKLMMSDIDEPTNIGSPEYQSVEGLVKLVAAVAKKDIKINYISGPVGVESRNFSIAMIESTGWRARISLFDGLCLTYPWIEKQAKDGGFV